MDNKPISIQVEEAKQTLANTINNLKINPYLLEPILKDLYDAIVAAKNQILQKDMAEYEKIKKGGTDGERSERAGED